MKKTKNNKMLMHGFILVTILATAKSAEAEITMEAAFQGHCGHTSPCEQLCYEIHDGMYECDCIEGYELNKNGYSCQVINATSNGDAHSKSDEDVLYQKGASFSAKLANGNDHDNQLLSAYASSRLASSSSLSSSSAGAATSSASASFEELDDDEDGDKFFADDLERIAQRAKLSSNDYYISTEQFNNNPNDGEDQELTNTSHDVPETQVKVVATARQTTPRRIAVTATTDEPTEQQQQQLQQTSNRKSIRINLKSLNYPTPASQTTQTTTTTTMTTPSATIAPATLVAIAQFYANQNNEHNYYAKPDMSIYDDVNNNQLNLRPLSEGTTYQDQYAANAAADALKTKTILKNNQNVQIQPLTGRDASVRSGVRTVISENMSISDDSGSTRDRIRDYCSMDCGAEGVCEYSDGDSKCLCPFGKTGRNCMEDMRIHTPKFAKHSWLAFPALRGAYKHVQVRVEFRPESFDGIILLSGERDDLTGDFMALLLNKGFVEFWFDCGSGVGNVRSHETILLNEWNSVIIYRHRWDAWLVLNHGTKVQGRSNGLFSRITFREPVFLGGTGNITGLAKRLPVFNGFVGCIRRFVANEHEYKFREHPLGDVTKGFDIQDCVSDKCFKYPCQHGGKCLPTDDGAVCLCPIGFVGDLCEIRMDLQVPAFNGSSYLRYAPLGDSALIWLELKVILKPQQPDGLILYSGPKKHGDFLALLLNEGFVEFVFDLGSGPAVVRSEHALKVGQWHSIRISRTARLAVLKIDQLPEVMTISSNGFWHLSLPENLFVGGVNHVEKLPLGLKSKSFFVGCIQKIDINGHSLSIVSEALGGNNIANCPHACVARPCGPLAECIPQMESYECRCNAFNTQCNKAAEVPLEELKINKAKRREKLDQGRRTVQAHSNKFLKKTKQTAKHSNLRAHNNKEHPPQTHDHARVYDLSAPVTNPTSTYENTEQPVHNKPPTERWTDVGGNDEDDIIFRDVHGMHRRYGHNASGPQHVDKKDEDDKIKQDNNDIGENSSASNANSDTTVTQTRQRSGERGKHATLDISAKRPSTAQQRTYSSEKLDVHHKHAPQFKLSRLPTHYESFQTNPDSDILTFDDNVELDMQLEETDDIEAMARYDKPTIDSYETDDWKQVAGERDRVHAHDKMNEKTKSEPYLMDETLFDTKDDGSSYQRKELAQNMQRIMANAPEYERNANQPKLVIEEYDYEKQSDEEGEQSTERKFSGEDIYKNVDNIEDTDRVNGAGVTNGNSQSQTDIGTDSISDSDNDDDVDGDDDDLLAPVQNLQEHNKIEVKMKESASTPQTHTDWSLLKKLELSADHQSQFAGVRKNFGACFAGSDSYFHYNDAETMSQVISYNIDLNLRIKTHSPNGVILWTGRQGSTAEDADFLSLGIENGYLHFRYDLGSGDVDIKYNVSVVSDGLWHRVRAIRDSQAGYLEVDGRKTSTLYSPGKLRQLNTDTGLYVGGMPDASYFTRRKYGSGIVGCISEIVLAGELKLNFDPNTLGTAHNVETGLL